MLPGLAQGMPLKNWKHMPQDKPRKIKLDSEIVKGLNSGNEQIILRSLGKLRSVGSIQYIPELLKLLGKVPGTDIEKELVRFLSDIKNPGAIPFVIKGLKDKNLRHVRTAIVSSCWQSTLDYRSALPLFVDIFFEDDYTTAIECFTVIEESAMEMEAEEVRKIRDRVLSGIAGVSEEKRPLAHELVRTLEI